MARPTRKILTEWETQIMRIIWDKGKTYADEIRETLREQGFRRSDSAIRCTLRILEKKGIISHITKSRTFIYSPILTQEQAESDVVNYLKKVFFPDSPGKLALRVLDETELTPEEIQLMKEKLEEAKKNDQ